MSNNNINEPKTYEEAYERYIEYRTRFEELEIEFDEYQQSSLNYEQELEIQLKQLDNQVHRLQQDLFVERTKNEQYRDNTEQTIKQFDKRFDQLQDELNNCKNLNNKLTIYIRELEQTNDDLERSKRTLLDSLSTFETKLNYALEQNALLENELDDKQQLTETVQRLRDETRDLREELDVLHNKTNTEKSIISKNMPVINSDRMQSILSEAAAASTTSSTYDYNTQQNICNGESSLSINVIDQKSNIKPTNDYPLSNSTRLESLKLINEALRRFTSIESTLSIQRKQSQTTSTINSNRSKHNSLTNSNNYTKPNELILNQTQF